MRTISLTMSMTLDGVVQASDARTRTPATASTSVAGGLNLSVIGSAALVGSLHAAGPIDVYTLLIHPLVLGRGRRMFDATSPLTELTLERSVATTTGVVIATYRRSA